jgi:hypothetical protein
MPSWIWSLYKYNVVDMAYWAFRNDSEPYEVVGPQWIIVALYGDQRKGLRKTIGALLETL